MCQYSLEGFNTVDAKEGDTLYVVVGHGGAFHVEPQHRLESTVDECLTCIKYGQKITIEKLVYIRIGSRRPSTRIAEKEGKRHVVTLKHPHDGTNAYGYGDMFVFDDGAVIPSSYVSADCPLYVGIKPTLEERLNLHRMDQVRGDDVASEATERELHSIESDDLF